MGERPRRLSDAAKQAARDRAAAYRKAHPEKAKAATKRWDAANREQRLRTMRQWHAENQDRARENRRAYKARKRTHPGYRLHGALTQRLRMMLKGQKQGRRTTELLGYTAEELRAHVEAQFQPGMTWENHGAVWHLDHILPVASFVVSGPDDPALRECHGLANLRPLWAAENIRKGAKIITA